MTGLKRKIPIAKIEKKETRAVTFSKRSKGLYSKVSDLCLLFDSKAAFISDPLSSNSNAAFYSFGHPSVDSVVAAFLSDQRPPPEDQGLVLWWEDMELAKSEDPEELENSLYVMKKMLHDLWMSVDERGYRVDVKGKKKNVLHGGHRKQTMSLQPSSSASLCIPVENFEGIKNTEEEVLAICKKSSNDELGNLHGFGDDLEGPLMNVEMNETNQNPFYDCEAVKGGELVVHRNFYENNLHLPDLGDDQFPAIFDNNYNDVLPGILGEFNQELDLDEFD